MTKRRICGWIAVLALSMNSFMNSFMPVVAADTVYDETDATFIDNEVKLAEVVSAYGLSEDNSLYALISPSEEYKDYDFSKASVSLQSNATTAEKLGTMKPISECFSTNIHYMFLIDNSASISEQRDIIKSYVDAIENAEKHEAYYTISTFDQKFKVVKERMTDVKEVKKTVDNLKYDGGWTDPYTGVNDAIAYLDDYARTSGDVIVLILITDGKVDLKSGKEADLAAETKEKIQNSPEVILSTMCTGSWTGKSKDTFTVGRGPHAFVNSTNASKNAGTDMVSFLEGLYCTGFKLKQTPASAFSITLNISNVYDADGNEQTFLPKDYPAIGNVSMLDARVGDSEKFAEEADGKDPEDKPSDDPDGTKPTEGTLIPTDGDEPNGDEPPAEVEPIDDDEPSDKPDGDGDGDDTDVEDGDDEDTVSDNEAVSENGAVSDNDADDTEDDEDEDEESGLPGWVLPVSIGGGVLLLIILILVVVVLILVISKSKKKKKARPKSASSPRPAPEQDDRGAEPIGRTVAASQDGVPSAADDMDEISPTVAAPDAISKTVAAPVDPIPKTAGACIPVSIEVYSGTYDGPVNFELTDLTTIGSGSGCDIRFAAEDMTPVAAQLIVREGHVYIVDEGTTSAVAVGGIRIQGQNVLRSGDVISVGEAEFTLRF
ncbi:MAG: VWA domain-containing protein [Lachnospiraceae bacterium]|nr:VWA domain-containing protein [Lachnospiraceae bacterium]